MQGLPEEVANHEVIYVGKGTADCAVDRLNGHSKLEKILADILKNKPNKEVTKNLSISFLSKFKISMKYKLLKKEKLNLKFFQIASLNLNSYQREL